MTSVGAVPIAAAAGELGVTTQRVHQMLREGHLSGPEQPAGQRAQRNAPRVWVASLTVMKESRVRRTLRRDVPARRSAAQPVLRVTPASHEAAALHMKVALDEARELLRAERDQASRITHLLAEAVAALAQQQVLTQRADDLSNGYSEALTNLLAPADVSGLDLR